MNGVMERIKNNVLLKCSTLNDNILSNTLVDLIDKGIYHFAEDLMSMISDTNLDINEETIRNNISDKIKVLIIKKIKRKLFIDSLALQITNDLFIEDYVSKKINLDLLKKNYIKELYNNKNSNQLNMTEDLNLNEIFLEVNLYIDKNINTKINENTFLVNAINSLVKKTKEEFENNLEKMINDADDKYLDILISELNLNLEINEETKQDTIIVNNIEDKEKGEEDIMEITNEITNNHSNKFEKFDDMTLFNKTILCLNTKEEKIVRKENKLEQRKKDIEEKLALTNKNIEANIEREAELSKRKIDLNTKELELNSKLSEAEIIFLNIKPLIKGLNKIKDSDFGGDLSE